MVPVGVRQFIEHRFEPLFVEDREILEAASVAGDPFSIAVVAAALALPDAKIESRCAVWQHDGHFVVSDGAVTWPDGTLTGRYRFRHALYQEVLYAGIAPERRARLHRAVGDRLQRAWGDEAAHIAAELAMHFEEGHDPDRALYYLAQAARNAVDRSAYAEARTHLERGQNLLQALPQGLQRSRRELELLLLLGRVLAATRGWAVREVEGVFLRAREICEELHDTRALLQVLWGLIGVTFVSADFRKAQILGRQVLRLATELGNPVYGVLGHMEVGGTAFHLGDAAAHSGHHFEEAQALYNVKEHRAHIACFGVDMGVFSRSWATHYLWHKGQIDGARASSEEALRLARELSHPLSLAVALAYGAMLYQFCRDLRQVNALAESTIRLCTEHGFPYYLSWAELLLGWSRAAAGEHEQGIAEIRRAIEAMQARAGARLSYYRALLAEACLWAGRTDEALDCLAHGFADIEKTGERWWESELHRLRGELLQLRPERGPGGPEACFHSALRVARAQGAKPLELRAGLSLGHWLRDQGQISEARQVLETVKDTVSEGFDLPDVREAESLLNQFGVSCT
jgi:predicted ATPase